MIAERKKHIAVVGMGNLLMSDDGVGVHVVQKLQKSCPDDVELIDAGTSVIHTVDCLQGMEHIVVVDALKAGCRPGTVYQMNGDDTLENDPTLSVHSLGLKTALKFLMNDDVPEQWMLIGVEPESLELGIGLSPPVRGALPDAVRAVKNLIKEWQV